MERNTQPAIQFGRRGKREITLREVNAHGSNMPSPLDPVVSRQQAVLPNIPKS